MKHLWYVWCKALGEKSHNDENIADKIAVVRTCIVMVYIITNLFIIAGIIKHWNG